MSSDCVLDLSLQIYTKNIDNLTLEKINTNRFMCMEEKEKDTNT